MQIYKPTTKLFDIGPLDAALRLPTASRIRAKMKTTCGRCRKPITDEYFIAGFKKGHRNMMFHESCTDEHTRGLIDESH